MRSYLAITLFALIATSCQAIPFFWQVAKPVVKVADIANDAVNEVSGVAQPILEPVKPVLAPALEAVEPVLEVVKPVNDILEPVVEVVKPKESFFSRIISFFSNLFNSSSAGESPAPEPSTEYVEPSTVPVVSEGPVEESSESSAPVA